MKIQYSLILVFLLLFSCEKQYEDAIPEGAFLGTPSLVANLNEEGRIILNWTISRFCAGWSCDPVVEGSSYEVFVKLPEQNDFVRIERLGKDMNEYMVPNTELGKPYEFYVISRRAGQVTTSNTVMIVPNSFPEIETVMNLENGNMIYSPKVNIQGDKVAYISNYLWTVNGQQFGVLSLFLKDLKTGENEMIRKRCYHPQWSSDGMKLVYGTTDGLSQVEQGYTPIHVESYDLETKEFSTLMGGRYQHNFPTYLTDDQSLLFLSDSLERREMGLWKMNSNGSLEALIPQLNQTDRVAGFPYYLGMDVSPSSDLIATDYAQILENREVYNIYGYDLTNGYQKVDLVVSPWYDSSASFSVFGGDYLAFVSDRSGKRQVWIKDLSSGELKQVSYFNDDLFIPTSGNIISWMDEGTSVAFPVSSPTGVQRLVKIQIPN